MLSAGSIAGASLAAAQEPPPDLDLAAMLSPSDATPGAAITVTSDDKCATEPGRFLYWDVWPAGEEDFPPGQEVDLGMQNLQADGSWTVRFDAPAQGGSYDFYPLCASRDGDTMVIEQEYAPLAFSVQGDATAPQPPAPPADRDVPDVMPWPAGLPVPQTDAMPVATPMPAQPSFTG
jgi:hypothetical protein